MTIPTATHAACSVSGLVYGLDSICPEDSFLKARAYPQLCTEYKLPGGCTRSLVMARDGTALLLLLA